LVPLRHHADFDVLRLEQRADLLGLRVDSVRECLGKEEGEVFVPQGECTDVDIVELLVCNGVDVLVGLGEHFVGILVIHVHGLLAVETAVLVLADLESVVVFVVVAATLEHGLGVSLHPEAQVLSTVLLLLHQEEGHFLLTTEADPPHQPAGLHLAHVHFRGGVRGTRVEVGRLGVFVRVALKLKGL